MSRDAKSDLEHLDNIGRMDDFSEFATEALVWWINRALWLGQELATWQETALHHQEQIKSYWSKRVREAEAREAELRGWLDHECDTCCAKSEEDCISFSCVLQNVRELLARPRPAILDRLEELERENAELREKLKNKGLPAHIAEALNSGDGVYRP